MSERSGGDGSARTLEEKILDELRLTGFPHEIITGRRFEERGWLVSLNDIYVAGEASREVDVQATRSWQRRVGDTAYHLTAQVIAECKKSETPWVFFMTPTPAWLRGTSAAMSGSMLVSSREQVAAQMPPESQLANARTAWYAVLNALAEPTHHYAAAEWLARTYYEPFAKKAPQIYGAIAAVCQAARHYHWRVQGQNAPGGRVQLFYPVIVLKGNLFEARVVTDDDIRLTRASHVQVQYRSSSQNAAPDSFESLLGQATRVDVVQEGYLEQFLTQLEASHERIADHLHTALRDGKVSGYDATAADKLRAMIKEMNLAQEE